MPSVSLLDTPLSSIRGIGPRMLKPLERLGLKTIRDLLWHFPTRYDDYVDIVPIAELSGGTQATVAATVESIEARRSFRNRRLTVTEATLRDETGTVTATWFNQSYVAKQLTPGTSGFFAGKVSERGGSLSMSNPVFERARDGGDQRHTGRLVPVYPETRGITSRGIRYVVMPILQELGSLPDPFEEAMAGMGYPSRLDALRSVHFPDTREEAALALERFTCEDLFLLQLAGALAKAELVHSASPVLSVPVEELKGMVAAIPFSLTQAQKQALWEVVQDISKGHPMNRLVQGDVGSGKTIVALLASHVAARSGYQAAVMAPTDVLARQHFETFAKAQNWLDGSGPLPTVAIISGNHGELLYPEGLRTLAKPAKVRELIASGKVDVAIGTHALISGGTAFAKLGLVVIDEQHRFGVEQRKALAGGGRLVPHFLSMTATPIPRTIMLTAFGDLATSLITEMPAGRQPVRTVVVEPSGRDAMYRDIDAELASGRQAFFVCPLIEHAEFDATLSPAAQAKREALLEAKSVAQAAEHVSETLPKRRIATLHGKMKAAEKAEVMDAFKAGKIDVLVSTTVIEVGVDVPNATVMAVESADRFGLAQLHQLRGRVGRGSHGGSCYLIAESDTKAARERLTLLEKVTDGFTLAEHDLRLRGPGQLLGSSQSGIPDLAMQHLGNAALVKKTRDAVSAALAAGDITKGILVELRRMQASLHRE
jgi:ATP-dependent DNA helicase RecG